jgi:hypothetical protein
VGVPERNLDIFMGYVQLSLMAIVGAALIFGVVRIALS